MTDFTTENLRHFGHEYNGAGNLLILADNMVIIDTVRSQSLQYDDLNLSNLRYS